MTERPFDLYVGIDWSGAKGTYHKGIQLAVCRPGRTAPELLEGPGRNGLWSRPAVLDWLVGQASAGKRWLAGIDFAFSYAHVDAEAYFPGLATQPNRPTDLWALVEAVCADLPDFYGGGFYQDLSYPYWRYYLAPGRKGDLYERRPRLAEQICGDAVTVPNPVFKCVGQANVGTGSLAGMRMLHRLDRHHAETVAIWPFRETGTRSVVLEIFPRLYFMLADQNPRRWSERQVIDDTLAHYKSDPANADYKTEDQADAVVTAAALRHLSGRRSAWAPAAMTPIAAKREGWIFGVE